MCLCGYCDCVLNVLNVSLAHINCIVFTCYCDVYVKKKEKKKKRKKKKEKKIQHALLRQKLIYQLFYFCSLSEVLWTNL